MQYQKRVCDECGLIEELPKGQEGLFTIAWHEFHYSSYGIGPGVAVKLGLPEEYPRGDFCPSCKEAIQNRIKDAKKGR